MEKENHESNDIIVMVVQNGTPKSDKRRVFLPQVLLS
jgi:hypothetical protein